MDNEIYTDGEYLRKNTTWDVEHSPWKAKQIKKILVQNKITPQTVCEVGCGAGEILNQLYIQMPEDVSFIGYDISPQAINLCKQRQKDRLDYFQKDLILEDVFFDVVLAIDVFEHVEDYIGFLKKLRHRGEYKIFHIPLDISIQSVFRMKPILDLRENVGHLHYFTKDTALQTLYYAGYEIIDYFYTPKGIDIPGHSALFKIPRKVMFKFNQDLAVRILGGYSLLVLAK